jgi:hypothetical protein
MTIHDAFRSTQSHNGEAAARANLPEIKASESAQALLKSCTLAAVHFRGAADEVEVLHAIMLTLAGCAFEAGRRYGRAEAEDALAKVAADPEPPEAA